MSQQWPPRRNGRPEFVTLIAIYQFITAGILLLLSCLIPAVIFPSIFVYVDATGGIFTGLFLATVALALLLGFAFASIVIGWGLLRSREWARLGAIVLAAFALTGFPVWTIVAILILIYLTSQDGRTAFHSDQAQQTDPADSPEMPSQAVYKAEPPTSPAEETRRIAYAEPATTTPGKTNGSPSDTVSADETGATAMPPVDPAWATETFYDEEVDVTDHYRRWKESLPQEPVAEGSETGNEEPTEPIEMPPPAIDQSSETGNEPDTDAPHEGDVDERVRETEADSEDTERPEQADSGDADADDDPDERDRGV